MPLSTGKTYLDQFADDLVAQRALLACAAALRLDDELAGAAIEIVAQANGRTRELLHTVKNLGCVWRQWDGSWYLAEDVRKELVGELHRRIPTEQVSKLRSQLADRADERAAAMPPDGQITAHQLRIALIEAGYQRTMVTEQAARGGEQLGTLWEKASPAAGEATARSVDYLAPEIQERIGQLPVQVLFLRGMAARARHDRLAQEKYFRAVWERGTYGTIFGIAAHLFGNLVRDRSIAERALNDSLRWDSAPVHCGHVFHSLGNLLAKDRRRWRESENAYRESLTLLHDAPSQVQVWHSLGNLLAKDRSRRREAEDAFRESLRLRHDAPHQGQVWHSLGNLFTKDEARWKDAEDAYRESLNLLHDASSQGQVGASFADFLSKLHSAEADDRAEQLALRSLELDRQNPKTSGVCYRVLADVYERRSDFPKAISALKSLQETDRRLGKRGFEQSINDRIAALSRGERPPTRKPRALSLRSPEENDEFAGEAEPPSFKSAGFLPPAPRAIPAPQAKLLDDTKPVQLPSKLPDLIKAGIERVLTEAWESVPEDTPPQDRFKVARAHATDIAGRLSPKIKRDVRRHFETKNWEQLKNCDPKSNPAAPQEPGEGQAEAT